MNSNKQQVLAGTLIGGRYNIVRPIGQGGMANVYLADDQTDRRPGRDQDHERRPDP